MTEPVAESLAQLVERVEDLSRIVARQAATIERLADEAKARARQDRAGADLPLVVELFALHNDTAACAATAESLRERAAFEVIGARVERLLTGRGAAIVMPRPDDPFDSLTMEAADVTATTDPDADRTVDGLVHPGLTVAGRSVRPAGVVVRRYRAVEESA
ncbi:nucleotide exchange factor GrpE [Nocardia sp. NPDC004654]|uniref:nucleotide exchange factor GrpE n=1 Tax=Nocardia sp. NPDC004654 TaxID=3154776 RepID=UPI0033A62605